MTRVCFARIIRKKEVGRITAVIIYILIVSIISAVLTVYDKSAAKNGGQRISERCLLILAAMGGAGTMLAVMKTIRHKTRKAKFMVTLPVLFAAHIIGICLLVRYGIV